MEHIKQFTAAVNLYCGAVFESAVQGIKREFICVAAGQL